jgi:hypothetical protein
MLAEQFTNSLDDTHVSDWQMDQSQDQSPKPQGSRCLFRHREPAFHSPCDYQSCDGAATVGTWPW